MAILLNQAVWASERKGPRRGNDFLRGNIYGKDSTSKATGHRSWQHILQDPEIAKEAWYEMLDGGLFY